MKKYDLEKLMSQFVAHGLVIRNYKPLTIRNYKGTFKLFLEETNIKYLDELNRGAIEKWLYNGRLNRKWSSVTFRHYYKHISVLIKWLIKEGFLEENYIKDIEKPKIENKLPRTINADQAQLILDTSFHMKYRYKYEKYRNRAVIALMLFAGLRRNEVVNLKLNDISIENKTIFIQQGKGSKDRYIPINARLQIYLTEYLKDRNRLKTESIYFFTSFDRSKRFGHKGLTKLIEKIRKKTKVDFSAHTLRHSFATLMLEGGCDIYTLSKMMGHAKITTTTIYLYCSNKQMSKSIEMHLLN